METVGLVTDGGPRARTGIDGEKPGGSRKWRIARQDWIFSRNGGMMRAVERRAKRGFGRGSRFSPEKPRQTWPQEGSADPPRSSAAPLKLNVWTVLKQPLNADPPRSSAAPLKLRRGRKVTGRVLKLIRRDRRRPH